MRRGRGCQRPEEGYNPRMPVDRGDAEWCLVMVVTLVGVDIVPCQQ